MRAKEEILSILRQELPNLKRRYKVGRRGLFGSYVRGRQKGRSDIDLLVELGEPTFDTFMDLVFFLEGLLGTKVDLVTTRALSPHIAPYVEREVVWV